MSSPFQQARPVLITSFVNKVCSLGMSLVPVLIVARHMSAAEGSLTLTCIKVASVVGTLAGGWMADWIGARRATLFSFVCVTVGLLAMSADTDVVGFIGLIVAGMIAQYGESVSKIAIRLLITSSVDRSNQKQSLGWMRVANNLAQAVSFSIGAVAAGVGVAALLRLDAAMAFAAFVVGWFILPKDASREAIDGKGAEGVGDVARLSTAAPFIACCVFMFGWALLYDMFLSGIAGRLELFHPGEGLRWFSISMVINTIICTALAVPATNYMQRPSRVFAFGIAAVIVGLAVAVYGIALPWVVFIGVLVITLAEVALTALTQYTLIRLTPSTRREGTWFGAAMLVAQLGRLSGAALCFPWIITKTIPTYAPYAAVGIALVTMIIPVWYRKEFDRSVE